MTDKQKNKNFRQAERFAVVSSIKGPVAFMMPADVGKVVVHASQGSAYLPITPNYAKEEAGVDSIKMLMAADNMVSFEAFRSKGARDVAHSHPDHHSVAYQKRGRVKMWIGEEMFIIEEGDSYFHPMGIVHQHVALEDSVRVETKFFPNGNAIMGWNKLVGMQ